MVKKKMVKRKTTAQNNERDSTYFLKLVLYAILGTIWLRFSSPLHLGNFALTGLPIGLIIGLFFASHDHFMIDRKIELAILLVMTILSFFLPVGIVI